MNIEEEKKLVAEKLMGWMIMRSSKLLFGFSNGSIYAENWNPQSDIKLWDEIFKKIGNDLKIGLPFMRILKSMLPENDIPEWVFLTAKPSICWKALIKTLNNL